MTGRPNRTTDFYANFRTDCIINVGEEVVVRLKNKMYVDDTRLWKDENQTFGIDPFLAIAAKKADRSSSGHEYIDQYAGIMVRVLLGIGLGKRGL